jgi:glycosyltransferase involved in cell wall biosynthesis
MVPVRVAVALPAYRAAAFIEHTLRSLLAQTHREWECFVVNDGEDDGTGMVVRNFGDPRLHFACNAERLGSPANWNRAMVAALSAEADIIKLLSADDVLYPHAFADIVRVMIENPTVGLVSSHFDGIDGEGRLLFRVEMASRSDLIMPGREYLLKGVAVGNTIGGPSSVAVRREALLAAGLFDSRMPFAPDADLWHRLAASSDIAWIGQRPGLQYRFHDASNTGRGKFTKRRFRDEIQVVRHVAATEVPLGPRWWMHQYTIGRLHGVNLQVAAAMARRRNWDGLRAALGAAWEEGVLLYAPFWVPRLPYQAIRFLLGLPPTRRLLLRRTHERLQPPRVAVTANEPVEAQPLPTRVHAQRPTRP